MRPLRTLAILGTLAATSPAAPGDEAGANAPPGAEAPPAQVPTPAPVAPPGAKRPEPPEPPREYLAAGARLFNARRYDLAAKYLKAAHNYRDRLNPNERVVLDFYREKLDEYTRARAALAAGPPAPPRDKDTGVRPASVSGGPAAPTADARVPPSPPAPAAPAVDETGPRVPEAGEPSGMTETWRGTADDKQKVRWLLQRSREQIFRGQYEAAERTIAEAREFRNIKWGFFDVTPAKMSEVLAKARAKAKAATGAEAHDRGAARTRLREARAALAAGDPARAEAIAFEVKSWGLRFGPLDDSPEKVSAAAAEARRRAPGPDEGLAAGTPRPHPEGALPDPAPAESGLPRLP